MRLIKIAIALLILAPLTAFSQSECPAGLVCVSQAAANAAAANARELEATRAKARALESALTEKDKSISEIRETARLNEADLRERLHKTEVELALITGQLTATEANSVRQTAIIDLLLKHVKKKKIGLINLF